MEKWYYVVLPQDNLVLAKSMLLSWARIKRDELRKRGTFTRIYEVSTAGLSTTMTPIV